MTRTSVTFFLFISLLFCGCEGVSYIEGFVISADTQVALDSVKVIYSEDRHTIIVTDTFYTDTAGHFDIGNLVMCVPKCPNTTLTFYKNGYSSVSIYFHEQILDTTLTILMKQ